MENQKSIGESVIVEGVNIFTGASNAAVIHPAKKNSGLVFLVNDVKIPAKLEFAKNKKKSIMLGVDGQEAYLVEHLLSAVYALGIDNAEIELSDGVCPTLDDCALGYFNALKNVRLNQSAAKKFWRYSGSEERVIRSDKKKRHDSLTVGSLEGVALDYTAYYPHKVIGNQHYRFGFDEAEYASEIANARPPGFLYNEVFKNFVLALGDAGNHGLTEENYLLVTSKGRATYSNPSGLGARPEGLDFVRHKILDVMGTLALTGRQFRDTEFKFNMTGHKFDLCALRTLFDEGYFEDAA